MGVRQRSATQRRSRLKKEDTSEPRTVERRKGANEKRRELYHSNPQIKAAVQQSAREYYRRTNPKAETVLANGKPLTNGVAREVIDSNGDLSVKVCYTMPAAAVAVGKTTMTFKKWIASGWIPDPVYVDSVYQHNQYTMAEIKAIVKVLSKHYETYDYLNSHHVNTIAAIKCGVEKARSSG